MGRASHDSGERDGSDGPKALECEGQRETLNETRAGYSGLGDTRGGHLKSKRPPTDTSGERPVPGPALPAQTQQRLTAPQAVPRVTAEGHRAPCEMASIANLVAKLGGSWVFTFDEFKTWG